MGSFAESMKKSKQQKPESHHSDPVVNNAFCAGGRPQEYKDGTRKLMTIRMYEKEMERLKTAAEAEKGGNLTKLVHDILMQYCDSKNYQ